MRGHRDLPAGTASSVTRQTDHGAVRPRHARATVHDANCGHPWVATTQRSILLEWTATVADARGWTRDETVERVNFSQRYPVDVGQEYMMSYIQTLNAGSIYDKLTGTRAPIPLPAGSA
jgi:hypothetical protein